MSRAKGTPNAKPWRAWTYAERDRVYAMSVAGKTAREIAEATGRSVPAVNNAVAAMRRERGTVRKDPRIHGPGQLARRVARLSVPGASDRDVAAILGVSVSSVRHCRLRLGIPARVTVGWRGAKRAAPWRAFKGRPPTDEELLAAVVRLHGPVGRRVSYYAERLGVSRERAYAALTELGLVAHCMDRKRGDRGRDGEPVPPVPRAAGGPGGVRRPGARAGDPAAGGGGHGRDPGRRPRTEARDAREGVPGVPGLVGAVPGVPQPALAAVRHGRPGR